MPDWKENVNAFRSRQAQELAETKERQRAEEINRRARDLRRQDEKEQHERAKNLSKLQKRFKCHICQRPAAGPTEDDWSKPNDLAKCSICHKWTCPAHIYKNICQRCAESL